MSAAKTRSEDPQIGVVDPPSSAPYGRYGHDRRVWGSAPAVTGQFDTLGARMNAAGV